MVLEGKAEGKCIVYVNLLQGSDSNAGLPTRIL